jgi:hypothetical protein
MPVGSRSQRSVQEWGFASIRLLTPLCRLYPLPVRQAQRFAFSFLQIPPRGGHPRCLANTSPCRVCRGLSPPSECALPGAQMKTPRSNPGRFSFCTPVVRSAIRFRLEADLAGKHVLRSVERRIGYLQHVSSGPVNPIANACEWRPRGDPRGRPGWGTLALDGPSIQRAR